MLIQNVFASVVVSHLEGGGIADALHNLSLMID